MNETANLAFGLLVGQCIGATQPGTVQVSGSEGHHEPAGSKPTAQTTAPSQTAEDQNVTTTGSSGAQQSSEQSTKKNDDPEGPAGRGPVANASPHKVDNADNDSGSMAPARLSGSPVDTQEANKEFTKSLPGESSSTGRIDQVNKDQVSETTAQVPEGLPNADDGQASLIGPAPAASESMSKSDQVDTNQVTTTTAQVLGGLPDAVDGQAVPVDSASVDSASRSTKDTAGQDPGSATVAQHPELQPAADRAKNDRAGRVSEKKEVHRDPGLADIDPDKPGVPQSSTVSLNKRGNQKQEVRVRSALENETLDKKAAGSDKNEASENTIFDLLSEAGENRTETRSAAAPDPFKPEGEGDRQGTLNPGLIAPSNQVLTQQAINESPAVQPQIALAAAEPAPGAPVGERGVHFRAADLADVTEHSVSIVRNGNRLAVQFEPAGLGKLDLDLRLDKGVVHAQIRVADEQTRSLIENNVRQITDALLKEGLNVGGFSVALNRNNAGGAENGRWYGEMQNRNGPPQAVESTVSIAARGNVSIFV